MKEILKANRAPRDASLFNSFVELAKKVDEHLSDHGYIGIPVWQDTAIKESEEYKGFINYLNANPEFRVLSGKIIFSDSLRRKAVNDTQVVADLLNEYILRRECSKKRICKLLDNGIFRQEDRDKVRNLLKKSSISKFEEVLHPDWYKSYTKTKV